LVVRVYWAFSDIFVVVILFRFSHSTGQTPMYCAARSGHAEVCLEILNQPQVNVNFQVKGHLGTPMHGAVMLMRMDAREVIPSLIFCNFSNLSVVSFLYLGVSPSQSSSSSLFSVLCRC
jgi:hypothetical protein